MGSARRLPESGTLLIRGSKRTSEKPSKSSIKCLQHQFQKKKLIAQLEFQVIQNNTMISYRIHKSWVTKVVKQTSFLQKKYNSNDCKKFGNPNQDDVADVWAEFGGDKIKDQYNLFGKLIWPASAADGLRVGQTVEEAPLTNLWLQFARWRLWINENISACYDVDNPKESRAGAQRVKKWKQRAHRKFHTLESRVCKHLYKGLVKTKEADN